MIQKTVIYGDIKNSLKAHKLILSFSTLAISKLDHINILYVQHIFTRQKKVQNFFSYKDKKKLVLGLDIFLLKF